MPKKVNLVFRSVFFGSCSVGFLRIDFNSLNDWQRQQLIEALGIGKDYQLTIGERYLLDHLAEFGNGDFSNGFVDAALHGNNYYIFNLGFVIDFSFYRRVTSSIILRFDIFHKKYFKFFKYYFSLLLQIFNVNFKVYV